MLRGGSVFPTLRAMRLRVGWGTRPRTASGGAYAAGGARRTGGGLVLHKGKAILCRTSPCYGANLDAPKALRARHLSNFLSA